MVGIVWCQLVGVERWRCGGGVWRERGGGRERERERRRVRERGEDRGNGCEGERRGW